MAERLRFVLLGHPIRHSISPAMHAAAYRALGLSHTYSAIDVPNESGLRRIVDEVRRGAIAGANVTVPYKRTALEVATEVAPSAEEVGAANALSHESGRVVAHNTDAHALAAELGELCGERPSGCAVILGAGGAALAAIAACRRIGFNMIAVTTRSWSGTEAMFESPVAEQIRARGALASPWPSNEAAASGKASQVLRMQWRDLAKQASLVVQATSAGMPGSGDGGDVVHVVPWAELSPSTVAYDVVYGPSPTPFLAAAARQGLRSKGGLGMLVRQAELSFELWLGVAPPEGVMGAAARDALDASGRGGSAR